MLFFLKNERIYHSDSKQYSKINIAGRLPEKSRNSLVDLQSQKIRQTNKISLFIEG